MSTLDERTIRIPFENRTIYITKDISATVAERTIRIPFENRTVFLRRATSSAERTVYVTELY
tara:strand:- start:3917 stop:4102 length:186 start_codon:yes stop_codon:yes gene_type:complete